MEYPPIKNANEQTNVDISTRDLLMQAPGIIALLRGREGRYELVNPAYARVFGNRKLIGKTLREAFPGVEESLFKLYEQVYDSGEPFHADEFPILVDWDNDGQFSERFFNFTYSPFRENGTVSGIMVFGVDVTSQVEDREKLRRQNEEIFFRSALLESHYEATPFAIVIADTKGKIISYNRQFVALWNLPESIVQSKSDDAALEHAMTLVADKEKFIERVKSLYKNTEGTSYDEVLLKDGRIIERYGRPVIGENGTRYGWAWHFRDITDRKKTERELQAGYEQLHSLNQELRFVTDTIPQLSWAADHDGKAVFFNKNWFEYTGLIQEDLIGDGWTKLLHPDDADTTAQIWKEAVKEGSLYEIEYRLRRHDGEYHWFLARGTPMKDGQGNIVKWYGTSTDIHEYKQFEEELEKRVVERSSAAERQKLLIGSILDASFNGIYALETKRNEQGCIIDFNYLFINHKVVQMMQLLPSQVIGKSLLELIPENKDNGFFDMFCQVLETGEALRGETHFVSDRLNGWFDYVIVPINKDSLVVTIQNITERKENQEQIEQQRNLLDNILQHSPSGITVTEVIRNEKGQVIDGKTIIANTISEKMLGVTREQLLRYTSSELDPNILSSPIFNKAVQTLETGEPFIVQYFFEPAGKWLELSVAKMDEDHLINVFTDVTPIKEAQIQLEKNLDDLKRTNASLEEFAYAASHDMKEPIRKIHFFADRLSNKLQNRLDDEERRYFERMEHAARRMGNLIDDLLTYSSVTRGATSEGKVNLNNKIRLVLEDLELEIQQKNARITVSELPVITGNKRQIQQLFQNLIGNALKYSKPDVTPEINITSRLVKGKDINQQLTHEEANKDWHLINVSDNGIGFEQQYADQIFQMFTRLHGNAEYKGTGVGLSIAQKVVQNHKGRIWAEGEPGAGSEFFILLPAE